MRPKTSECPLFWREAFLASLGVRALPPQSPRPYLKRYSDKHPRFLPRRGINHLISLSVRDPAPVEQRRSREEVTPLQASEVPSSKIRGRGSLVKGRLVHLRITQGPILKSCMYSGY